MLLRFRYERVDELIWVKTNQLQRIIRTGRTGHWFNHGKEHCLVRKLQLPASWLFSCMFFDSTNHQPVERPRCCSLRHSLARLAWRCASDLVSLASISHYFQRARSDAAVFIAAKKKARRFPSCLQGRRYADTLTAQPFLVLDYFEDRLLRQQ